ncbi:hypothetical protein Bb109J_c1089 [Bdellovibrio bacteriovorus]|uniref:hypothetical protein n=1 Tax=Bdellovibrio bacteriovorus TaxID=959 RepID=UPI00045C0C31|nr:hypothetical protein [Bdellovibrio bacteriovorus]AHZ86428.1 hypothetical protein EP01_16020 [Bdellovibrio bacteriovorus]BEV67669.1 hypothetical protein Bb109J_c1089 [Bdellovibrio bacteriovorus]
MEKIVNCPLCKSIDLIVHFEDEAHQLTLGAPFNVKKKIYECSNCGEIGEFDRSANAVALKDGLKEARHSLCRTLITDIQAHYSMSTTEKLFELPARTLNGWKSEGDPSAVSLAFLRVLHTYPEMLHEAAKVRFDSYKCTVILAKHGQMAFKWLTEHHGGRYSFGTAGTKINIEAQFPDSHAVVNSVTSSEEDDSDQLSSFSFASGD